MYYFFFFFFSTRNDLATLKQGMRKEKQEFQFVTTKTAREVEYLQVRNFLASFAR